MMTSVCFYKWTKYDIDLIQNRSIKTLQLLFTGSKQVSHLRLKNREREKVKVGVNGFEPSISRPPDAHFNRTKLHPEFVLTMAQIYYFLWT